MVSALSRPSVGRPSSVGRRPSLSPLAGRSPVASSGRGVVVLFVLLSRVPCRPPCRGVARRVKRERVAGSCKGAFSVGVVRRGGRGRSSLSRSRVAVVPVPPFGGGRVASVLSPCPSCPSVSPRRRGRLSAGAVRPFPVVGVAVGRVSVGVGRAGVSAVRGRGSSRSVACPSVGVAGGGRACRLSARVAVARLSPSPLAGGRRGVSVAVSPLRGAGLSPISPYPYGTPTL